MVLKRCGTCLLVADTHDSLVQLVSNVRVFDVKKADAKVGSHVAKGSKTCLTVNATDGTIAVGRGFGNSADDRIYQHDQVCNHMAI